MINLFLPCSCHVWLGAERTSVSCCLLQNMICLEMSMFIFPVFFFDLKKKIKPVKTGHKYVQGSGLKSDSGYRVQ